MMAEYGRACGSCRYAVAEEVGSAVYACHRFPPLDRRFPVVLPLEWCGEYKVRRWEKGKKGV